MKKTVIALAVLLVAAGGIHAQTTKKDSEPESTGSFFFGGTGGPDAFGYTFADSTNPECSFQWVDITGSNPAGHGDDTGIAVALGGAGFDFYGTLHNSLGFTSNGYLTDAAGDLTDFSNDCPQPNALDPSPTLAVYWDDLDAGDLPAADGFSNYFAVCPRPGPPGLQGCNVFQWNTQHFPGDANNPIQETFQAILYDSYHYVLQFDLTTEAGSSSTSGGENDTATIALDYACNAAASINPPLAVCFFHPDPIPVELESVTVE